jgi:hypothetical protein
MLPAHLLALRHQATKNHRRPMLTLSYNPPSANHVLILPPSAGAPRMETPAETWGIPSSARDWRSRPSASVELCPMARRQRRPHRARILAALGVPDCCALSARRADLTVLRLLLTNSEIFRLRGLRLRMHIANLYFFLAGFEDGYGIGLALQGTPSHRTPEFVRRSIKEPSPFKSPSQTLVHHPTRA